MKTFIEPVQTEVDTGFLYGVLAKNEKDETLKKVFEEMSKIEYGHAEAFLKKEGPDAKIPGPSFRAKTLTRIGSLFGYQYVLGVLLTTEQRLALSARNARTELNLKPTLSDVAHVLIVKNIIEGTSSAVTGSHIAEFEKPHRSVGGNAIRAAVLGGNDGLVSNFSLIMGIAGATGGQGVVLAGVAGLLAGALSMALGEWISVKSSQELYENQMRIEKEELENNPEGEEAELALIYMTKGFDEVKAKALAKEIMTNKDTAYEMLVKEELGIAPQELEGSPMEAAVASFLMFSVGAVIPLVPFLFTSGMLAIGLSVLFSSLGLFCIGSLITLFTGRSVVYSGLRQVIFGVLAAIVTFAIGRLIGVSIS